jgi:UDP-N-acetyl-D-galactosamine dehydrogenase
VVAQLVKAMTRRRIQVDDARVLVMGLTFKENCPDLRNSRVVDIVRELGDYNVHTDVFDPWVNSDEALREYGFGTVSAPQPGTYDAIVLAVGHRQFREMGAQAIRALGSANHVLYDLKYVLGREEADLRL